MSEEGGAPAPTEAAPEPAASQEPTPDWRAGLPEDIASHDLVRNSADVAALAKQAIDMQAYQGQSIRVPSEHASEEDRAAFRDKLRQHAPSLVEADLSDPDAVRSLQRRIGLPENPDGYRRPELQAPDGVQLDYGMLESFQPMAHEAGLTQGQFETIVSKFTEANVAQAMAARQQHIEGMEALKKDWGYAFDEKLRGAKAVADLAKQHVPAFDVEDLTTLGPGTLKFLADMAERLGSEGSALAASEGGQDRQAVMTPEEAEAQRQEILRNREHPYWAHPGTPGHQEAVQQMLKLTHLAEGPGGRRDVFQRADIEPEELMFEGPV